MGFPAAKCIFLQKHAFSCSKMPTLSCRQMRLGSRRGASGSSGRPREILKALRETDSLATRKTVSNKRRQKPPTQTLTIHGTPRIQARFLAQNWLKSKWGLSIRGLRPLSAARAQSSAIVVNVVAFSAFLQREFVVAK